jgi:hypothetical protein
MSVFGSLPGHNQTSQVKNNVALPSRADLRQGGSYVSFVS